MYVCKIINTYPMYEKCVNVLSHNNDQTVRSTVYIEQDWHYVYDIYNYYYDYEEQKLKWLCYRLFHMFMRNI